ncbi:MAG TPA: MaoC family dehydratase N-terminal domain-containing protein [Burkholderiales bacterium]|nr:MaoC family dehydratase N-terminal domain-containing protein [Burkholderiales bacterium]
MNAAAIDLDHFLTWVGRTETRNDLVTATPIAALSATLDRDDPAPVAGAVVPPMWHWLYFLPISPLAEAGPDGHPKRGGFLPPVPLPRRMFAGGRLEYHHDLKVGDEVTRSSRILDVSGKEGRSGTLVFVTVRHEFTGPDGLAMSEEHDIVYRENPSPDAPVPRPQAARTDEAFSREIVPDPVMLFRYSALTFNSHRIHYDRSYVTQVEGYPGLIVHGPLIATLLADLWRRQQPQAKLRRFEFRAVRPLFDIHRFTVCGRQDGKRVSLWTRDHEGCLTMDATAELV